MDVVGVGYIHGLHSIRKPDGGSFDGGHLVLALLAAAAENPGTEPHHSVVEENVQHH